FTVNPYTNSRPPHVPPCSRRPVTDICVSTRFTPTHDLASYCSSSRHSAQRAWFGCIFSAKPKHTAFPGVGAGAGAACPEMQAGKIPLTSQTFPMDTDCRLLFEPSYDVGHTELGRTAKTQVHMIGHRVALRQFDPLLLAEDRKS